MTVEAISGNVQVRKKTGGAGKALASASIPGLGQFLDGRNKQGAIYLGLGTAAGIGSGLLYGSLVNDMFKASDAVVSEGSFSMSKCLSKLPKGKLYGFCAASLAGMAIGIANIVDAYKGNRNKAQ